ncbi:MAG TPA: phytanoyl-CoA dioxygenase family protein [Acidimicrobiales bacterium]|jgi:ectoine hydroxylase-related dioxygenase (phytanoyl-CoA dioxygenase family)
MAPTPARTRTAYYDEAAFGPDQQEDLAAHFAEHGYAILRGALNEPTVHRLELDCERLQRQLEAGELSERHGTSVLVDDAADGATPAGFANYVTCITEVVPSVREASMQPVVVDLVARLLGQPGWLMESMRSGVLYQDARPGPESRYTRIGWHTDWQSGPHLPIWPSVAFTIHIDQTSPANGFLRVVPGSHRWQTPAPYRNVNRSPVPEGSRPSGGHTDQPAPIEMPLGFERVRGELAIYCERGDILFHDAYLWHSAARATDDASRRRHIRGSWYTGQPLDPDDDATEAFVKNAAR